MWKSRMNRFANVTLKWVEKLCYVVGALSSVVIIVIMFAVSADTIGRSGFNHPIQGVVELCLLLMIMIIFLGLAHTQAQDRHISIDVLHMRLPRSVRRFIDIFVSLVLLVMGGVWAWRAIMYAAYSVRIHEYIPGVISFPKYPSKIVLAAGVVLFVTLIAARLLKQLTPAATEVGEKKSEMKE